jgi:hypothetical protein
MSAITLVFSDVEPTAVSIVQKQVKEEKYDEYYTLSGIRVAQPTKGLYIVNGKKVFVK